MKKAQIGTKEAEEALKNIHIKEVSSELEIGEITLKDIIDTLTNQLAIHVRLSHNHFEKRCTRNGRLQKGMELQGTVRNVVDFGAFVDIGVKQDGLVHISKLKKGFVKHPLDVVCFRRHCNGLG